MKILPATPDHAAALVKLHKTVGSEYDFVPENGGFGTKGDDLERMEGLLKQNGHHLQTFLAYEGEILVGNLWAGFNDLPEKSFLGGLGMAVLTEYHGRGYGSALLHAAEAWFREKDCRQIVIDPVAADVPTVCFFLKRGYGFESLRREVYFTKGKYWDQYTMVKLL